VQQLILGTAGHIDHGKTSLIRALTGVDTDRLQEEKERGITIDLGFAELAAGDLRFGIVDVPGHEAFVKNMLAGATGVDVVLVVVAADEGVMPQTREHLAIVELLGVARIVVALTKSDLVEAEWLELAAEDVRDALAESPWPEAPILPVSATTGQGLEELVEALGRVGVAALADPARQARNRDLLSLPVDRSFTVRGTGTVVTGTLRTGRLRQGDRVRLIPAGLEARVRGLQLHGSEVEEAFAGARTAVALAGDGVTVDTASRGQVLVGVPGWEPSSMLTARVRVLPGSEWELARGQRVRVHLGTAEVLARCVLLGTPEEALAPGSEGWVQLRLERPAAARVGERFVLRSYSPVITFAGGTVVEYRPPKRRSAGVLPEAALSAVLAGDPVRVLEGALELAGPAGIEESLLPVATGLGPQVVEELLQEGGGGGPSGPTSPPLRAGTTRVGRTVTDTLADRMLALVDRVHAAEPYRPGAGLEELRGLAPPASPRGLADAVVGALAESGQLVVSGSVVHRPGFAPVLTPEQEGVRSTLLEIYRGAGLQPPATGDLPERVTSDPAFPWILRALEESGALVALEAELFIDAGILAETGRDVARQLAGAEGLGPADFKEVIPVSRRYLLPVLRYLDGQGVTRNDGSTRSVPAEVS
jgi:selenocysteine-specific elongation factor